MKKISKNNPPSLSEVQSFREDISFTLPEGFLDFYSETDGADISSDTAYTVLWSLTEMIALNNDYNVHVYAPEFFIFGSDGGDAAFAIEKSSGNVFEMPFIGMSSESAVLIARSFTEFLDGR